MSRCGYVALIGQPNVGKSTLMNHLLGQKISITSRKPQTTRHQILGIKTDADVQAIFIDTPGMHRQGKKKLNALMNRAADSVLNEVNVILLMLSAEGWQSADDWILSKLTEIKTPVIAIINKIDTLHGRNDLLPFIEQLQKKYAFAAIIPLSAKTGENVSALETSLAQQLPESPHVYSDDELSNRSMRFIAAEIVREKLFRLTGQEIPYSTAVEIELFKEKPKLVHIAAVILVERPSQKKIVIGKAGINLKRIGQQARFDLENLLEKKVFLQLWVKIKDNWADDARMLKSLGYDE